LQKNKKQKQKVGAHDPKLKRTEFKVTVKRSSLKGKCKARRSSNVLWMKVSNN
jgi:hypothetical protein